MTPADLRQRVEAATPGPWFFDSYSTIHSRPLVQNVEVDDTEVAQVRVSYGDTATGRALVDAVLIALAPDLALALADAWEAIANHVEPTLNHGRHEHDQLRAVLANLEGLGA